MINCNNGNNAYTGIKQYETNTESISYSDIYIIQFIFRSYKSIISFNAYLCGIKSMILFE